MSQSPLDANHKDTTHPYHQGWRALNRLLHEGRSFSGNEKHCAFLNTGPDASGKLQPFADVSSAIGFDFAEDGRALGFVDWDFDGDLDLWITNRTAPRLRLLKNNNSSNKHFLSLRLQGNGTSTNRDAIGARVALHLAGESTPRIKTLHAGHTFLSQSSRWLHFGIGTNTQIEKLVVQWPAGGRQEFRNLQPDQFYQITQNRPATQWKTPSNLKALTPSTPEPLPPLAETRVITPPGVPLPPLMVKREDQAPQPFQRKGKGLLLVNLWSSFCLPCQEELASWAKDAALFKQANIEVVALLTDGAGDPNLENANNVIAKSKFPFPWTEAAPVTIRSLDAFHAAALDLWNPLPVPSSFLIDSQGNAVAIYTGPVHAAQIVSDAKLATASPRERRDAAVPFPGLWVIDPYEGDPLRVATQMIDRDEVQLAIDYLLTVTQTQARSATTEEQKTDLGESRYTLGLLLGQSLRLTEAMQQLRAAQQLLEKDHKVHTELQRISRLMANHDQVAEALREALESKPDDQIIRFELALLHLRFKKYDLAAPILQEILARQPKHAPAHFQLANCLLESNQPATAVEHFKLTLRSDPKFIDAANRLSWVLAAHPLEEIRVPNESLHLAARLCQITREQNPRYLDTLATAQAANGQFPAAVATAKKALALYNKHSFSPSQIKSLEARLQLFEAKTPYRESRWIPKP